MKTQKTSVTKLVSGFDTLLKNMLMADIKTFKAQSNFIPGNLQSTAQVRLSVA